MNHFRRGLLCAAALLISCCAFSQAPDADSKAAEAQALAVFKSIQARDWKDLYDRIVIARQEDLKAGTKEMFASAMEHEIKVSDPKDEFGQLLRGMTDISVGGPIIEGASAYVPTSCTVTYQGISLHFAGIAKMKKVGGTWKWDLSHLPDTEKATAERTVQIFGQPVEG